MTEFLSHISLNRTEWKMHHKGIKEEEEGQDVGVVPSSIIIFCRGEIAKSCRGALYDAEHQEQIGEDGAEPAELHGMNPSLVD